MKLTCRRLGLEHLSVDFFAVVVGQGQSLGSLAPWQFAADPWTEQLDSLADKEKFEGKAGQSLVVDSLGLFPSRKVGLFGVGNLDQMKEADWRRVAAVAARAAHRAKAESMALWVAGDSDLQRARALAEGVGLGAYRFVKYLTGKRVPSTKLSTVTLLADRLHDERKLRSVLAQGSRIASCVNYARDLVNEPSNELGPAELARFAEKVAKKHGLSLKVYGPRDLAKMGARLMLAVGQGSAKKPRLIHLTYRPAKKSSKRLVVVGKGVTFDSGGLSIKGAAGMGEMKSDMAGAANVIALLAAVAEAKLPIEVHGIAGAVENMPDGAAYRPGDVFRSLEGKTVEIINTDAEGRLVLADALAYANRLEPSVLVCNATLTGACVVALGEMCSGFFATDDKLAKRFRKAAKRAGEQFWQLPLLEDQKQQLSSDVADLKHAGDRWGGAITAALFLREFVGDTPFIHCDIAGPALAKKDYDIYPKGGTGQAVLTFLEFARNL